MCLEVIAAESLSDFSLPLPLYLSASLSPSLSPSLSLSPQLSPRRHHAQAEGLQGYGNRKAGAAAEAKDSSGL